MRSLHRIRLVGLMLGLMWALGAPASAWGAVAEVSDGGGFFSPDAVAQANHRLAEIAQKTGRDLRIETYAQIPAEMQPRYSKDQQAQFFANWADERAQQIGVRGVMVLVSRNPRYLTVQVGRQTRQAGIFTSADESRLRDALLKSFHAGSYDQGLKQAIDLFQQAVEKQTGAAPAVPPPDNPSGLPGAPPAPYRLPGTSSSSSAPNPGAAPATKGSIFGCWTIVFFAILIICGVWVLRRLFGSRSHYGTPYSGGYAGGNPPNYPTGQYPPPGYGRGYGGGGFGRGFGGGILGGLLGGWLGGRMFRNNPAQGAPPPTDQPGGWNEPPAPPSEFGGGGDPTGGGSFGDSGGGNHFGGGDDFGGGGDASGGGSF
jgi:uncharacterized membrane protein YgcG